MRIHTHRLMSQQEVIVRNTNTGCAATATYILHIYSFYPQLTSCYISMNQLQSRGRTLWTFVFCCYTINTHILQNTNKNQFPCRSYAQCAHIWVVILKRQLYMSQNRWSSSWLFCVWIMNADRTRREFIELLITILLTMELSPWPFSCFYQSNSWYSIKSTMSYTKSYNSTPRIALIGPNRLCRSWIRSNLRGSTGDKIVSANPW